MLNDTCLISIVITTCNRSLLLDRAIKSIISQNYQKIEIIVIDDNSSDNTRNILMRYQKESLVPFQYIINDSNKGPSINRKVGLNLAKGKYIVFMDDDDYYCNSESFKNAIAIFGKYKNLSFVSGNSYIQFEESNQLEFNKLNVQGYISSNDYLKEMQITLDKPFSTYSTIFLREKLFESEADRMEMFNDSSIYLRALLVGDAYVDQNIWGVYYIHENNISKSISCSFIVQNLEEKNKIYLLLAKKNVISSKWLIAHFKMTIKYFFSGDNVRDLDLLFSWIKKKDDIQLRILMNCILRKELLKRKIKNKVSWRLDG